MLKTTYEKLDFSVYNDYIKEQRTIKTTSSVIVVCSYKLHIHKNNLLYVLSIQTLDLPLYLNVIYHQCHALSMSFPLQDIEPLFPSCIGQKLPLIWPMVQ